MGLGFVSTTTMRRRRRKRKKKKDCIKLYLLFFANSSHVVVLLLHSFANSTLQGCSITTVPSNFTTGLTKLTSM